MTLSIMALALRLAPIGVVNSGPPPPISNGFLLEGSATDLILTEGGDYILQE